MPLFSWLKPKPGSSHWLAWIQSKRKRYSVTDALPQDTSECDDVIFNHAIFMYQTDMPELEIP